MIVHKLSEDFQNKLFIIQAKLDIVLEQAFDL